MPDREKYIEALSKTVKTVKEFNEDTIKISLECVEDILELLKEQEAEIRQLRLALDIAKGTYKGIKSGGGQFADMPTMQSAT